MKVNILPRLALPCALLLFAATPGVFADDHDKATNITIAEPMEVPGGVVLQPGTYMFKLMEITGNRHVVQIRSEDGKKTYAVAMTAAAFRTQPTDKTVLTFYEMPSGQPQAVRKWFWPSDVDGQEFLYPKKRAAEISKVTNQKVPEAPEDQPVADNTSATVNTSSTDNTPVADNTPAAVTPAPEPPAATQPVVTAAAITPEPAPATPPAAEPELVAQAAPPPNTTSSTDQGPSPNSSAPSSLPQTASELPLMALIGSLSLSAAIALRHLRRA